MEEFAMKSMADGIPRRRFLSLVSASAALALGSAGCSKIDRGKIVPYTKRPEEVVPGVATWYASTFQEGLVTHGLLVKTREGRPIHLEGNAAHPISRGQANLRAMADILGLYDPDRLRGPLENGAGSTWEKAEREIVGSLKQARDAKRPVLLLTDAVVSPTRKALIDSLKLALPNLRHAAFEPAAPQSEILAAQALYGEYVRPRLRFDRAEAIVSVQADFLGADGDAPAYMRDFAARRSISSPAEPMNRLWAIEGSMTLTGANADQRIPARPSKTAPLLFALARHLNERYRVPLPPGLAAGSLRQFDLDSVAKDLGLGPAVLVALAADLHRAGKSALVIGGAELPQEAHVACQLLNAMLGAESYTVDATLAAPSPQLLTFAGLRDLLQEAEHGAFAAAVFWNANPAYAFPMKPAWTRAVAQIPLKVRIGLYQDETALDCHWSLPEHHWLEAWGDFEPAADLLSLRQPAIAPIFDSRQGEDMLLSWLRALGAEAPATYFDYLKSRWQKDVYPAASPVPFETFWNAALHDGVLTRSAKARPPRVLRMDALSAAIDAVAIRHTEDKPGDLELTISPDAAVHDGRYANNGWLNELPNPVTKATWGNPLLISIADAARLGLRDEDVVRVTAGEASVEAPVIIQPGQAPGVASLALGYGRRTGNVAAGAGVNAYLLIDTASASPGLRSGVKLARIGARQAVPRTQTHFLMEGRDLARSWTKERYAETVRAAAGAKAEPDLVSLSPFPLFKVHKWGMAIDLSACTGCSACVIACQSENNIPVVGPEQVGKGREMHWIRIDRYYEGDQRTPQVAHQPVLCQHCDDAPCETVCPVNATTHSPDGLNQMTYNRCVGTRYCSNNCPYKVRRFNFFDYTSLVEDPARLVFNPDVTVRPRGVMEKCSFCIQRIQEARQKANVDGRPVKDGEIVPACAAACPAHAIAFGDINDPHSRVSQLTKMDRGYRILTELGVKPSITYLADISNPVGEEG
jgi:molybdopterin-containing oxidoreductase family iron-sulfur binding subunit